jgi:hypothetical protein
MSKHQQSPALFQTYVFYTQAVKSAPKVFNLFFKASKVKFVIYIHD